MGTISNGEEREREPVQRGRKHTVMRDWEGAWSTKASKDGTEGDV